MPQTPKQPYLFADKKGIWAIHYAANNKGGRIQLHSMHLHTTDEAVADKEFAKWAKANKQYCKEGLGAKKRAGDIGVFIGRRRKKEAVEKEAASVEVTNLPAHLAGPYQKRTYQKRQKLLSSELTNIVSMMGSAMHTLSTALSMLTRAVDTADD